MFQEASYGGLQGHQREVEEARKVGKWEQIVSLTESFLAQGFGPPEQEAVVHGWRGKALRRTRPEQAFRALYDALDLAREANLPLLKAELLADLLALAADNGDPYTFRRLHDEYEAIAAEWPEAGKWRYGIYLAWGVCQDWYGDIDGAAQAYRLCIDACISCREPEERPRAQRMAYMALTNLAGALLWLGRADEAAPVLIQARARIPAESLHVLMNYEAHYFLQKGLHSLALAWLAEAQTLGGEDAYARADVGLTRAMVFIDQGRHDEARAELRAAWQSASESKPPNGLVVRRAIKLLRQLDGQPVRIDPGP